MICDRETNIIHFSELLFQDKKFSDTCTQIIRILDSLNVTYKFLPDTKDIWARDYMPIQVSENKYIEYRYDPDYLQGIEFRKLKSYPDFICDSIGLKTIKTDIILDGGNMIKSTNCIILTEKIIEENKDFYKPNELTNKLKEIFEVDRIVFIPWDKEDIYGHADGMVRFINDDTVLIQGYYDLYVESFRKKLYGSLEQNGLSWEKLVYDVEKEDDRNWAYMNFLQTKDLILVPTLGIDEDDQALKQIKKYYPNYAANNRIRKVNVADVVEEGGALNCITWTIQERIK